MTETPNDPYAQREQEKYENPIPSREFILSVLEDHPAGLNRNDLYQLLELESEEHYEGLRRRLRAMERDGQVIFSPQQTYIPVEKVETIVGTVIGHRDGFGWVHPDGTTGRDNDLVLPYHQMRRVLHGDRIAVVESGTDRRGRKEARIVKVIEATQSKVVGRYFMEEGKSYVVADDSRILQEIAIDENHRMGARMGNVVVVELLPREGKVFTGKIIEVLGENMGPGMETEIAIRTFEIPHKFSKEVIGEADIFGESVPKEAYANRRDLRDLPLITIDGEDARDFDDAVYCRSNEDGSFQLWVAIADVSYYVRPGTALDEEAVTRGNSVYFPSRVVPMLPEALSNGLCSLNPQVDRLCMVCEMRVSDSGELTNYTHYEGVMNSHARLTYTKVHHMLEGDSELRERYKEVLPGVETLHKLYEILKVARQKRGGIEFDTVEPKFIFNEHRKIDRIEVVERNDAHKLIEECMILANIASARLVAQKQSPSLYRVHETPSDDRLTGFKGFLDELGLSLEGGEEPTPMDYAKLVKQISGRPDYELITTMLLRSMKQAIYSPDNHGHFGLALQQYAHFTSPIRRYPDLLLHRSIKHLIAKQSGQVEALSTGARSYSENEMVVLGEQCSMTERRADEATRDVANWLKCEYMQDHVGDEFEGVIANVTGFGFFVRLNDIYIDGLVHVNTLEGDYYRFEAVGQRLVGETSGQIYRLGDVVKIKVLAVNLEDRQIDFALLSSTRTPRGAGKTQKKKDNQAEQNTAESTDNPKKKSSKPRRSRNTKK